MLSYVVFLSRVSQLFPKVTQSPGIAARYIIRLDSAPIRLHFLSTSLDSELVCRIFYQLVLIQQWSVLIPYKFTQYCSNPSEIY